jgi:hypothetical protein
MGTVDGRNDIADSFTHYGDPNLAPDYDPGPLPEFYQEQKPPAAVKLTEFLAAYEPPYDWVVTGLLERGDRGL